MAAYPIRILVVSVAGVMVGAASELSRADSPSLPKSSDATAHEERQEDPYLPGPGIAPPTLIQRFGPVVRDGFVSVQVNVNALGLNIPGDAANEPSIAIDPTDPNKIVIGWRQFSNVASNFRQAGWAYSHDGGLTWTFAGVLQSFFRSDPVLDSDANGNFYYYSLSTVTSVELFISSNGGVSWIGPIPAFGGDKAWMVIDRTGGIGHGNIYATWSPFFSCCPGFFTRSSDRGSSFIEPIDVPSFPFWGTLAVGPEGDVYASGAGISIARSSSARDPSATPEFEFSTFVDLGGFVVVGGGPNPGGLLGQNWVATDHSSSPTRGNVYLLQSVQPFSGDPLDVMFARSTDRAMTWSSPVRVNDDSIGNGAWQWFGTMSVAPNGRIDVVWNDTRSSNNFRISELFYSSSLDAGVTWSPNIPVSPAFNSHLGWPNQNKIGDYYDMISDNGGVNVAYAATHNGEQDVYFIRIPADCNGNGVPDTQDIIDGRSDDCDANDIPDECQAPDDCNGNGALDFCDLVIGTSLDCNGNRVPDECEPDEDCNNNGTQDICDIAAATSRDCNENLVPDECDLRDCSGDPSCEDCNNNAIPDGCDPDDDCNQNGVRDICDIASGISPDCNGNGVPDSCDIAAESSAATDSCGAAQPICPDIVFTGTTMTATNDGAASCAISEESPDVWYRYTPVENGTLTVSLCGSSYDTALSIHTVCPGTTGNEVVCNDDACGLQSELTISVTVGVQYLIRIAGFFGDTGDFTMILSGPSCRPTSLDCNANMVPDECEPDCNDNGRADECDIRVVDCGLPGGGCPGLGSCCDPGGNGTRGCECSSCCRAVCATNPLCCTIFWAPDCATLANQLTECGCDRLSSDCDIDGVPDECEPDLDCNANGIQDICDVADGTSDDCDADGVPDECENDTDSDGTIDDCDGCPADAAKTSPGACGCGVTDVDDDADTIADCHDQCPGKDDRVDDNQNGTPDCLEIIDVPLLSVWGITCLVLILLILAKLRFRYRQSVYSAN